MRHDRSNDAHTVSRPEASPTRGPSRRSILGLLSIAPVAAGGLLACTTSNTGPTESSRTAGVPADLQPEGRFDRFVADQAAKGQFSGTLLLARHGQPVLTRSHGMANRQLSLPNREDTRFALGSMNKSLTSTAIAQLVEAGELAFGGRLGDHLDGFPAEIAGTVTVHHLLTHTSGVGRSSLAHRPRSPSGGLDEMLEAELAAIRQQPLLFPPGTRSVYSNDGFTVLGAIVAAVSGQSYYDYVREHIFVRAGMTRTECLTGHQVLALDDIAHPYSTPQGGGELVDGTTTPDFASSFSTSPAGGAFSTAPDLLRFAVALQDGTLMEPSFARLITSGKVPRPNAGCTGTPRQSGHYAYGFSDHILDGQRHFGHNGGSTLGVATQLDIFPDLDWVAVILTNSVGPVDPDDHASSAMSLQSWINPVVELERELITQQAA